MRGMWKKSNDLKLAHKQWSLFETDDHSRVVLEGDPNMDYINASFISVRKAVFGVELLYVHSVHVS